MRKVTRMYWLEKLENKEASVSGYINRDNPVIADYHDGKAYRYQLLMKNNDVFSINEHGNVCRIDYNDGSFARIDNLFSEVECLGVRRVDKRLANLRDAKTKKKRQK